MKGFKEFLLRGNLIDLAVAFIMATAFGAVVTAFTELVVALIAFALGGATPEVGRILVLNSVDIAPFINAVISFVIMATVVYFGIVKPYQMFQDRFGKKEPEEELDDQTKLLGEIRDLLAGR